MLVTRQVWALELTVPAMALAVEQRQRAKERRKATKIVTVAGKEAVPC